MRVHRHASANAFLEIALPWLLEAEAENNLMIGIARRFAEQPQTSDSDDYWATIHQGNAIVGASFRTPLHHLALSTMPRNAIAPLAKNVAHGYSQLSGVAGPAELAKQFARHWTDEHGCKWRTKFRQRIHALRSVARIDKLPKGSLRRMQTQDQELIQAWMEEFLLETGVTQPVERVVSPLLEKRAFFLWEDDEPRCLAGKGRDSPNGACITAVYTPPAHRGNGYATAAVATLSQMILDSGCDFCCLYTDRDNPASNSIYRKIGYAPVRDDVELFFESG